LHYVSHRGEAEFLWLRDAEVEWRVTIEARLSTSRCAGHASCNSGADRSTIDER
jgi:hypothetical protein